MESFVVFGLQFSIIATAILMTVFYLSLIAYNAIWYLAKPVIQTFRTEGVKLAALYTSKTSKVLRPRNLQARKIKVLQG